MSTSPLRILVPLHYPAAEEGLVRLTATLATRPSSELHLVHVVTPGLQPSPDIEQRLERAARLAQEIGVKALSHLERGPEVTQVIDQLIRRYNCNLMAMGWQADVRRDAILAATNRALTKSVQVDTLILKDRGSLPARRLLVPTGGGNHSLMGLQIAHELARAWKGELEVVRIARDPRCQPDDLRLRRYCAQLREDTELQLRLLRLDAPVDIVPATDVIESIVDRARTRDLIVLGASNDWRQDEHLAGSIPDEIANRVSCSVLMVRASISDERIPLSHIFWEHTIRLDMHPKDKWEAIGQMIDALVEERQIPATERQKVLEAALTRERQLSTALGHQTAIPHAPIPELPGIIGCLGICPDGVDFQGPQNELIHFIFLLLTPQQNYRLYIPVLSQIANFIRPPQTREAILRCQTPAEVTALIKAQER